MAKKNCSADGKFDRSGYRDEVNAGGEGEIERPLQEQLGKTQRGARRRQEKDGGEDADAEGAGEHRQDEWCRKLLGPRKHGLPPVYDLTGSLPRELG